MEEHTQKSTEARKSNMMPMVIGVVVLLLLGGGAFVLSQNKQTVREPAMIEPTVMEKEDSEDKNNALEDKTENGTPSGTMQESTGTTKTFTVTGSSFKFDPEEIHVKKGDSVKIVFKNAGGMHDLVFDDFNVRTQRLAAGQSETIEFVADKIGTFEYYCSVGNHRAMGMEGDLIVE